LSKKQELKGTKSPNNRLHQSRATGSSACLRNPSALAGFAVPRPQVNLHVRSIGGVMTDKPVEPNDYHEYRGVYFKTDGFDFFLNSVAFYLRLLQSDIDAIESSPDLRALLPDEEKREFQIYREVKRVERLLEWFQGLKKGRTDDFWEYELNLAHGTVRFLKSTGLLYLQKLRKSRETLSAKPNVSKYALETVDQKISRFEEILGMGVFKNATPQPLLIDELFEDPSEETAVQDSDQKLVGTVKPSPVVIETIEIMDPMLRERCLDLFDQFQKDGQHDRLDTVVTEATRILEDRIRKYSGAEESLTGVDLARFAFGKEPPVLIVSSISAEQDAAHLLFRGVFGFIRNHVHHHLVSDLSPQRVLQMVGFVDYLLSVVEGSTRGTGSEG
jgi:uncharacterized protein (TIGR02391 family)